ncbi:unnamed protein product [Prorocentrum cordatum]|uniref:RRM domain-containing protein n=1 Tax=Prorocentrum cordatum TaxID=2364126 RepID=A0ABN9TFZ1_9DINO|nr:unnamed protein product [Polarella glacialis]
MAEAAANGFGKAEAPAKPTAPGPYTPTIDQEKRALQNKLWELQKSGIDAKAKWWSFCKIHAEGNTDPKNHDVAFLQTFFESYEAGDIGIEEGCPFTAAKGGKDSGKGWGKDGGKAGGKDGGKGWGKDSGKGFGKDSGKGWGKDSGKGFGKDSGKGGKGGKGDKGGKSGGGKPNDCKIFVGGVPKGATEDELKAHFTYYGTVVECSMKYDDWGGFRGFAFVVFDNAASAQAVLADAANQTFKGKWIDCKNPASNTGDKGGSKGGDKGGKFDKGKGGGKFDKGGKGGGKFDKGGKGGGKFDKGGKGGKGGGWGGGKW